jgi:hypothetical protein
MANQAIALQSRAPQQGNFLAPAIQQAGQIANRMAQQQALDRQTAVAQQAMEIERAKEGRAVALQGPAVDKATAMIAGGTYWEKNGNKYAITISNVVQNADIPDSKFSWNTKEHAGVEVVDLR